jgi:putative DNA primase/helicase
MRPGEKVDTVLVLEGKQGIGKSSLFQALVPDPSWFSDSMPHDLASKDAKDHLRGKWIIELPELAQFKRTELAALKGFLTTATDTYRQSYGRHEVAFARQCVFVASTNESEYLADPSGGRRYWPVRLTGEVDLAGIRRDRDQLWAEAVQAFGRGEAWWLSRDDEELAAREQEDRQEVDPWRALIRDYLSKDGVHEATTENLLLEVLKVDRKEMNPGNQKRVARILDGLGWVKCRKRDADGVKRNVYQRRRDDTAEPAKLPAVRAGIRRGRPPLKVV